MLALEWAESTYAMAIGRERFLQRLAHRHHVRAAQHEGISTRSTSSVRSMDKYVQNAVADVRVAYRDYELIGEDVRLYRFQCRLGDFYACVADLPKVGEPKESLLKRTRIRIVGFLCFYVNLQKISHISIS